LAGRQPAADADCQAMKKIQPDVALGNIRLFIFFAYERR